MSAMGSYLHAHTDAAQTVLGFASYLYSPTLDKNSGASELPPEGCTEKLSLCSEGCDLLCVSESKTAAHFLYGQCEG